MEQIKRSFQGFIKYRYLLGLRVKQEIQKKYKNSALGIVWSLLNPLLQMIVMTIVFSTIFNRQIENFPLYMISGRLLFNFFADASTGSLTAIVNNAPLIQKVYFPKYILIASRVLSDFIIMLISMIDLALVMLILGAKITIFFLYAPFFLILLAIFVLGCSLIVSSLTVFFRDIEHLYGVLTMIIMYFSAIFYPDTIIPDKYRPILLFNPVFHYIAGFRHAIYYGTAPGIDNILYCTICSLVALMIGIWVFKKNQDRFILYL